MQEICWFLRYFARKDELLRVSYGFDSRREYQNDCEDSRFFTPNGESKDDIRRPDSRTLDRLADVREYQND